ncbi:P-loop containing nucleoside triphosphate hydrolase protein, partial [Ramicandelaber brevisporus]
MPVPLPPLPTKPVITYYEPSPSPRQLQPQPQLQPRQYQRQQQQQQRPSYRQQAYQQPELVSPPSRYQQQLSQSQYFDQTPQLLPESAVQHETIGNTDGLVSVNQLPPQARSIFSFSHFNAMQSRAFESIMSTNDNIVLSSPTGSGKSAICELAVIHLLFTDSPSNCNNSNNTGKVLYIAPTKALCAERAADWSNKFGHLGFPCIEITGDSDTFSATITERIRKSTIIVSTPEKWDTILRRWRDGDKLMETVRLLLVDEVHHLSDQRGATLEAVITRMRLICKPLRVVAVSATVPNIRDIAKWLCESRNGRNGAVGRPAHVLEFGNEYRAVPLQCHVLAYPDGHGSSSQSEACVNPFLFEKSLDSKLLDIILQYSDSRPTLVFCSTRKSAEQAANALLESAKTRRGGARSAFRDRRLSSLALCGIGYHHAGLDIADRRAAESAFSSGQINVLFTTSTLAVGVNLPARLVIVKSTMSYTSATASAVDVDASGPQSSGYREYTALELQQMVGRAGRPCFDSLGVGVIMTRESSRARCQQAVSGNGGGIPIESTLHLSLIEHLVAEISLGTVCDLATAVQWLENTYLAVRIRANPANYRMDILSHVDITNPQRMLVDICRSYLDMLRENGIVVCIADRVQASEIGRSMTRNCVRYKTAKPTSSVPNGSTLRDVLMLVSRAEEYGPFRFRQGEKGLFNNLNRNPMLRYPIKGHRVQDASDKIVLMIQAILLGIPFASSGGNGGVMAALNRDVFQVLQIASRVLRCMIDYLANTQLDASLALRNAITLLQYVHAKAWGDSSLQALQQIDTVGRQYASALIKAGINSIPKLLAADPSKVEAVLSRNPPFGLQLIKSARSKFP